MFGPRERNWVDALPYKELFDGVMHLRSGQVEVGVGVQVPNTVFLNDYTRLMLTFRHILHAVVPPGSRLRVVSEVRPAPTSFADDYRARLTAPEPGLQRLYADRLALLEQDRRAGDLRVWETTVSVRLGKPSKAKLDEETLLKRTERAHRVQRGLANALSAVGFAATPLGSQDVFALCYRYLNPSFAGLNVPRRAPTRQFFTKQAVQKLDGCRPTTLRTQLGKSTVNNGAPAHLLLHEHYAKLIALETMPSGGDSEPGMMHAADAAGEHFFLVLDIHVDEAETTMRQMTARARRAEGAALSDSTYVDPETRALDRAISETVEEAHAEGHRFFKLSAGLVLFGRDLETVQEREQEVYSALSHIPGNPFAPLSNGVLTPYLQFAPFSGGEYPYKISVPTTNAVHFFPVSGPWLGTKRQVALYRGRYFTPVALDPFDPEAEAYNGLVVGPQGTGKSFFTQHFLSDFLGDENNQVIIIDRGSGYRPLIEAGDGAYMKLEVGENAINPFDLGPDQVTPTGEQRGRLLGILREILPPGDEPNLEDALLDEAVTQTYRFAHKRLRGETFFETPLLSSFAKKLMTLDEADGQRLNDAERDLARKLALGLRGWTGESTLGQFVDRPTSVPTTGKRLIYYDTDGFLQHPKLKTVGTLLISNLVWSRIKAHTDQRTLVILDEGWALLRESTVGRDFVSELFKRARKLNTGIYLVTQSRSDVADHPDITRNLNLFFGLASDAEERESWRKAMNLSKRATELSADVTNVKGEFAEALSVLKRGDRYVGHIVALHPTQRDYWTFTSDPVDVAKRDRAVAEHGSLDAALPSLVAV